MKNNKKKLKAPKLRFPEFTDDWEKCELGQILKTHSFRKYLAIPQTYGDIEIIQQGDKPILGYSDGKPFTEYADIILFGDHTVSLYKPTKPFFIATDGVKILSADGFDGQYLFATLERYKPESQGYKRHFTILKNKGIWFTKNKNEQFKIGSFFKEIDQLITLNQNKISHIKDLKAGLLQKMFPKNGENKPEIRFDGFTSDWKECLMENLVTQVVREVSKPKEPYKRVSVRSHAKGTFQQKVEDASKISMSKLFIVKKNDLIVNITFAWEHAIAVATDKDDGLLVSHRFPTYRSEGKSDINFIHYLVSKEEFRKKMDLISPGGAGRNRVLNKKEFLKISSFVPELSEQQKIGEFFSQLDNLLILYQRKLEHLQEQKKSLLKQMFI